MIFQATSLPPFYVQFYHTAARVCELRVEILCRAKFEQSYQNRENDQRTLRPICEERFMINQNNNQNGVDVDINDAIKFFRDGTDKSRGVKGKMQESMDSARKNLKTLKENFEEELKRCPNPSVSKLRNIVRKTLDRPLTYHEHNAAIWEKPQSIIRYLERGYVRRWNSKIFSAAEVALRVSRHGVWEGVWEFPYYDIPDDDRLRTYWSSIVLRKLKQEHPERFPSKADPKADSLHCIAERIRAFQLLAELLEKIQTPQKLHKDFDRLCSYMEAHSHRQVPSEVQSLVTQCNDHLTTIRKTLERRPHNRPQQLDNRTIRGVF